MSLDKVHNQVASETLKSIVKRPIEAGGGLTDTIIILESVTLGVLLLAMRKGYTADALLEELTTRVKQRIMLQGPAQGHG